MGMNSSSLNRRVGEGSWTSLEIKRKSSTGTDGNIMLTDSDLNEGGPVNSISTYESSTRVKVLGGNNLHFKSQNYIHPSQINTQVKVLGANNLHFKYKIYFHPGVSDGDVK